MADEEAETHHSDHFLYERSGISSSTSLRLRTKVHEIVAVRIAGSHDLKLRPV